MAIDDERKKRILKAIQGYQKKQDEALAPKPKRKNNEPEELVARACMAWFKSHGFDMQRAEAKAKLSHDGRWVDAGIKAGTSDCFGNTPTGHSCFVEYKAPGKRSSFWRDGNERQQDFILFKIEKFSFACVVDSVEMLSHCYELWAKAYAQSPYIARSFLFDHLPKKPKKREVVTPLFDE